MLSFQGLYERYSIISGDNSTTGIALGKAFINEVHKQICNTRSWPFTKKTNTYTTTASQASQRLAVNHKRVVDVYLTSGGVKYPVDEIADPDMWARLTAQGSTVTSDFPRYYHVKGNVMYFYPVLSSAGNTLTITSEITPKDMSQDDYTTGTISDIANGDTEVTGSGTTFTSSMVGRYIQIDGGDWYEIASYTDADTIDLVNNYEGVTISGGSASYKIGELPLIPEGFEDLLWYGALMRFYMKKEATDSIALYKGLYEDLYKKMVNRLGSSSNQTVIEDRQDLPYGVPNINDYPMDVT